MDKKPSSRWGCLVVLVIIFIIFVVLAVLNLNYSPAAGVLGACAVATVVFMVANRRIYLDSMNEWRLNSIPEIKSTVKVVSKTGEVSKKVVPLHL